MVVQFPAPKHKKGCEAMSKEVKAIIYARQSSGDDDVSASVEQQVKNCQQLARECGYCVVGIFRDLNISGKFYPDTPGANTICNFDMALRNWAASTSSMQIRFRQGLGEAFAMLKEIDFILLDDFTRLMRPLPNSYLEGYMKQELICNKVKLHCVKGGIADPNSFGDNIVSSLISMINANQLEIQRQKSKAALKKLKDDGYRPSGANMRGYRRIGKHKYEIVPKEADFIREAFAMGVANFSYMAICRKLSKKYGIHDLHYDTLIPIYQRPEYAGYCYNSEGELIESKCFGSIPIVTLSQFLQLKERLRNKRIHNHDRKHIYAFTGLCYCGYCGERMQIVSCNAMPHSLEAGCRLYYFGCVRNIYREHSRDCGKSRIRYSYPFPFGWRVPPERWPVTQKTLDSPRPPVPPDLYNIGLRESLLALIVKPLLEEQKRLLYGSSNLDVKINRLEQEKERIMSRQKTLANMFQRGSIPDEQFEQLSRDLKNSMEKIRSELLELTATACVDQKKVLEELKLQLHMLQAVKNVEDNLYKKHAQQLIERINIFAYHIEIFFRNGKSFILERIPRWGARIMPNWNFVMRRNKAYIKYYYKSFYQGDERERVLYDDKTMNIVAVGCNPRPKAWADSPSRRWNWRTQEISDTFPLESTGGQSFEDSHTE